MKQIVIAALAVFSLTPALAQDKAGNGGDICENRFVAVRDDVRQWIEKGGGAALSLPPQLALAQYQSNMTEKIRSARVSCVVEKLYVGEAEKTCKNFVDASGVARILCNEARFMATDEQGQYVLVHHEYAGLAGFESNNGEASQYTISNQISASLENEIVKKLAVRDPSDPFDRLKRHFGEYLGRYEIVSCNVTSDEDKLQGPQFNRPPVKICDFKIVTLALSATHLEKRGYLSVDMRFSRHNVEKDVGLAISLAFDLPEAKLSKGRMLSKTMPGPVELDAVVTVLGEKTYISLSRFNGAFGTFWRVSLIVKRVPDLQ